MQPPSSPDRAASVDQADARAHAGPGKRPLPAWLAALSGWALAAAVSVVRLQLSDPVTEGWDAIQHAGYAAGHLLGAGLVAAALTRLGRWLRGWKRFVAVAVFGAVLAWVVALGDLLYFAGRQSTPLLTTLFAVDVLLGCSLAAALEAGRLARRGWPVAVGLGAVFFATEPHVLAGLYPGLHLFGTLLVATFVGAALTGARAPRIGRRVAAGIVSAAALVAVAAYTVPPTERVHFLGSRDGDVVVAALGAYLPRPSYVAAPLVLDGDLSQWMEPRRGGAPVAASDVARVEDPVVVMLSIDCLRYDLASGASRPDALPVLRGLSERSLVFDRAYSPGAGTVITLTSLFSGQYYSQLEWRRIRGHAWAGRDRATRFPALLRADGVWTVHAASFDWLHPRYGVTRGFAVRDYRALPGPDWKTADTLADALIRRIGEVDERRAFLYAHFNDPHQPYDSAGSEGSNFDRYVREAALVDRHVGRILRAIQEAGLSDRTYVVVTADHGESFWEHGRTAHGGSLYQELVHVPLIVHGPGIEPGRHPAQVSLIDLGPTILDLFELPTPRQFMGQSLLPLLHGDDVVLSRPILSQSGSLRAWLTPDDLKVIIDTRRGTAEAYDLRVDPRETRNIIDDPRAAQARTQLDAFFEAHQFRAPGYEEPLR